MRSSYECYLIDIEFRSRSYGMRFTPRCQLQLLSFREDKPFSSRCYLQYLTLCPIFPNCADHLESCCLSRKKGGMRACSYVLLKVSTVYRSPAVSSAGTASSRAFVSPLGKLYTKCGSIGFQVCYLCVPRNEH